MKLKYRGVSYEAHVPLATDDSEVTARYRGISYQIRRCVFLPAQPVFELTYRGITYLTGVGLKALARGYRYGKQKGSIPFL
jgi:hypothetical protein